ncbi:MAG: YybS family protein [Dehalobacterium sp.]
MSNQDMKNKTSVRALTEGALMAALAALLGIIGIYIPVLGMITALVWTVPIILLIMRHNMKIGLMGLAVTGLLIAILAGPVQSILFLVNMGGMALIYGYCFKNMLSPLKALLFGTLTAAVSTVTAIALSAFVANLPLTHMITDMKMAINEGFKVYESMGIMENILPEGVSAEQYKEQIFTMFETLLPGALVGASMGLALINYLIVRQFLKRLKYTVPEMPLFRDWHLPWQIVWGVILGLTMFLVGRYLEHNIFILIGQNILYIYYPILLVSGISFMVFLWKNNILTGFMRVMVVMAAFLFSTIFFFALIMIGLFDPLFDYRRFFREKETVK